MTAFDHLDAYLARDFNPDYWYDDACRLARRWISEFSAADWAALRSAVPARAAAWQGRCAYALIGAPAGEAAALLLALSASEDDAVAATAVSALRTLQWDGGGMPLPAALDQRLDRLAQTQPMAAQDIGWLRQRLRRG